MDISQNIRVIYKGIMMSSPWSDSNVIFWEERWFSKERAAALPDDYFPALIATISQLLVSPATEEPASSSNCGDHKLQSHTIADCIHGPKQLTLGGK